MQRIHFIAIGGSAMHNLAIALHQKGYHITGSDDEIFEPSRSRLAQYGLLPETEGWDAARIRDELDAVIVGMHAKKDNPELQEARRKNIALYSFPEYLFNHSKNKKRVVVGGSHGKTTTTAMILHVLHKMGINADYMVGAQLEGFETMVSLSDEASIMILEGDEYLTSPLDPRPKFHVYKPHTAVITGIAWDHMNVFPTFENYLEQFRIFIQKIQRGGRLIYTSDDKNLRQMIAPAPNHLEVSPYDLPRYEISDGITIIHFEKKTYPMEVFGKHNLRNMEAARLVCRDIGISGHQFWQAMQSFKGASRRLEKVFENDDSVVFRDFAHAPSKVAATLEAVRNQYPDRKVIACFELHTYSSLNKDFLPQYQNTLNEADTAVVFYTPHTLEIKRLPALQPEEVIHAFGRSDLKVLTTPLSLRSLLHTINTHNSVILIMSSGDFGGINWLKELGLE